VRKRCTSTTVRSGATKYLGTPVSDDYASAESAFTGKVEWVQIDVDAAEDPDHLISPEERFRVALARQ
jgi:hypothetical protein